MKHFNKSAIVLHRNFGNVAFVSPKKWIRTLAREENLSYMGTHCSTGRFRSLAKANLWWVFLTVASFKPSKRLHCGVCRMKAERPLCVLTFLW